MSHCKACDALLDTDARWTVFDKEYEGVVPECPDDLCQKCKLVAKLSFQASKKPFDEQERDIKRLFYSYWADSKDTDVDDIMATIESDGSIGIDD